MKAIFVLQLNPREIEQSIYINYGYGQHEKILLRRMGNSVNMASRMESCGIEASVQITQNTFDVLQDKEKYIITERENSEVKGVGKTKTYLIKQKNN